MNPFKQRRAVLIVPTFLLVLVLAIVALSLRQPAVSASPPPDAPQFVGEPYTAVLDLPQPPQATEEAAAPAVPQADWQVVFSEDFEGVNWDADWLNLSLVDTSPYKYGTVAVNNPLDSSSQRVAWAVGSENLNPNQDGYPAGVDSVLVAGPFDFSDAIAASLSFEYAFDALSGDLFSISASTNCSEFVGLVTNGGGDGSWSMVNFNLDAYVGEPGVCLAFRFQSDNDGGNQPGLFLDNVALRLQFTNKQLLPYVAYGFTPTPPPSPTPTITPSPTPTQVSGEFLDQFTNDIDGWAARRWNNGSDYEVRHRSDCEEDKCGFLEATVNSKESYVLVSPLASTGNYPYNIEILAKMKDRRDLQSYSIVFGGNWNGDTCPSANFDTCFNNYYEMRVRYRIDSSGDPFMEYKLKRIDSHNSSNQSEGPDLIEWTKVKVDTRTFVEWDVNVSSSGTIRIAANNKPVGEVRDRTYLNANFFAGLIVRAGDEVGTRVKFDYFKID